MPSSMRQTRMRSPLNSPIMGQRSAFRSRIPTMVFAVSRFATPTATSCSSVGQSKWRRKNFGKTWSLLLGLESVAHSEHVPIGMAQVHLANIPRHIGRRKCDLHSGGDALLVHLVDVVHPDRHPDALVALFISVLLKRGGVRAAAAPSLRPLTKKNAGFFTRSHRAEGWRRSPVPQFLPSPLLKPRERAADVRHVQYRSHTFGFHNRSRITPGN